MNTNIENKRRVFSFIEELNKNFRMNTLRDEILASYLHEDVQVELSDPFGNQKGISEHREVFYEQLLLSFPDLEIVPYLLLGGEYMGKQSVCCAGNFVACFQKPFLGIPANKQVVWIRFHLQFLLEEKKITHAWYFIDIYSFIRQLGYTLLPQRGAEQIVAGPSTQDGIVLYETKDSDSKKSFELVNNMLLGLLEYDGKSLSSMGQERFWDTRNMMWYGPAGIGTTRSLKGFQDYHQIPFLTAFPNRGIIPREEQRCALQIADGNYMCDFGFPSMYGKHTGDGWLGLTASKKQVQLRVTDIWRREGNMLKENWVMIDMIHVLDQLGIDLFQTIKDQSVPYSV